MSHKLDASSCVIIPLNYALTENISKPIHMSISSLIEGNHVLKNETHLNNIHTVYGLFFYLKYPDSLNLE